MIKVVVVDDKLVNRKLIQGNLNGCNRVQLMWMSTNGDEFLTKMANIDDSQMPDVVLMDLDMPVMNGIESIAVGTIKFPQIKFLVLTVFDDDEKIFEAIQAGAHGYLLKDDTIRQIEDAIINVVELNGVPMSPVIARKTLLWMKSAAVQPHANQPNTSHALIESLSDREIEILKLLVDGLDYKKIATQLFISPLTVRTHISKIYDKLHINNKAQAIQIAHKLNWL